MNKHTPGPWALDVPSGVVFAGGSSLWVGGRRSGTPVAVACALSSDDEVAANTRLIAAAPDMLAALQARAEIRRKGMMYCSPGELREALDLERDAIAKATGQVPT